MSTSDLNLQLYLSEQLKRIDHEKRCCMKFSAQLFTANPSYFVKIVQELNLRMRPNFHNGQESIIVYRESCHHMSTEMELKLCSDTVKDMYVLHCGTEFCGSQQDFQCAPEFLSPGNLLPAVPPHRFSLGPLKQSIARCNALGQQSFQMQCPIQLNKDLIMRALERNRVLVINGGPTFSKSTAVPMYIIEKCTEENRHCKIICVEREQLVAIHNSEFLAGHLHEKVGETVAYQIQLQSRISDKSNLVYTTSSFFLRVLMGQSIMESFRHISHIVIVDVHFHEAYADLLLRELKEALKYHPYLKVVLLSNYTSNFEFLHYFGEGEELNLQANSYNVFKSDVLYVDQIRKSLPVSKPSANISSAFNSLPLKKSASVDSINIMLLDNCLEKYERTASAQSLEFFLYMVQGENANVNHRHSITGRTALNIASMLGNVADVKTLLKLNANPYITDNLDVDALKAAHSLNNLECFELLKAASFFENAPSSKDWDNSYIDHLLITDIIYLLSTSDQWKKGNIIVFLPSYQHLILQNYEILKQKLLGNLPENITIFLLHSNTEKSQLDAVMKAETANTIKLILSTDIGETLMCFQNIAYVVDTARQYCGIYDNDAQCKKYIYEWASKHNLENRQQLVNKNRAGVCFRLIPKELYNQLPEVQKPELLTMPLDRICLSVKLLSPQSMVAEFLQETITKPPFIEIYRTVENLKKIGVFTDLEDITWLGCRLIDVPVECCLGKLLVFSILLQCLDPVLTIVSFMTTLDPFEISFYMDELVEPYRDLIRSKLKDERKHFSEGFASDHLMFLRLYQEWQNELRAESNDSIPSKYNFVLSGLLEHICNVRTQLVGALRSSQLIHNKGNLSMHYINLKSNCWPIIKAALAGGLYPNICVLDRKYNRLKSPVKQELVIHPNSVLRDLSLESLKEMNYISPWIIYGNRTKSWTCNSISDNTVVTAISVALFAGPTKLSSSNTQIRAASNLDTTQCYFHVDEWISFKLNTTEAQLLLKTRQHFYSIYINYLQRCGLSEKGKRPNISLPQNILLFNYLEKMLVQEDINAGFKQPERPGLRPKAVPNNLMMSFHGSMFTNPCMYSPQSNANTSPYRIKQYLMVYVKDARIDDMLHGYRKTEWFHLLSKLLDVKTESSKLTFVIFYTRNPDYLKSVAVAEWGNGYLELYPVYKYNISLQIILNNCSAKNADLSLAIGQKFMFVLDQSTGMFVLNLFAYRNNWLHNN